LEDGKVYIGCSSNIAKRFYEHTNNLDSNKHINLHLQHAWNKYGKNKFSFEAVFLCQQQDLGEAEKYFIDRFDTFANGYNNSHGGETYTYGMNSPRYGKRHSEETKRKISIAKSGRCHSKETIEKIRVSSTGREWSDSSKKKLSLYHAGRPLPEKTKKKISDSTKGKPSNNKGKVLSPEIKRKISIALQGKIKSGTLSHRYGVKASQETRRKMSERKAGKPWTEARRKASDIRSSKDYEHSN
jgi:group I intron endonuclease